jgi:hypothetical protein
MHYEHLVATCLLHVMNAFSNDPRLLTELNVLDNQGRRPSGANNI